MKEHELKTWPGPFENVMSGAKRFEIRKNDRGFATGDILVLREWFPGGASWYRLGPGTNAELVHNPARYTGRTLRCRVLYMTLGGEWGLPKDLVVMSIENVTNSS